MLLLNYDFTPQVDDVNDFALQRPEHPQNATTLTRMSLHLVTRARSLHERAEQKSKQQRKR